MWYDFSLCSEHRQLDYSELEFSGHAIRRMFERRINEEDVLQVVRHGKVIIEYADDKPYPSYLLLGYPRDTPLHVVIGVEPSTRHARVITVYIPDDFKWDVSYSVRNLK